MEDPNLGQCVGECSVRDPLVTYSPVEGQPGAGIASALEAELPLASGLETSTVERCWVSCTNSARSRDWLVSVGDRSRRGRMCAANDLRWHMLGTCQ